MQRTIPIKPKKSIPKGGLKPDFLLFDDLVGPPIIAPSGINGSQFIVQQYTVKDPAGNYKPVQNVDGVIAFLEGTAFTIQTVVVDPEIAIDPFDVSKLRFRWYRNGSYLYDTNNVNDFTGVNSIAFTEAQCTSEISGVYTLEVINGSGTTTSQQLTIRIYNKINVPELYGNLIQNGNAEAGLDGWDVNNGITTAEYMPDIGDTNNFASIEIRESLYTEADVSRGGSSTEFPAIQPQKPFFFCRSSNWASLLTAKLNPSTLTDNSWHYTYTPPNLISNEDAGGRHYGCFYPSKHYLDQYNGNLNKLGLVEENKQSELYFTRQALNQTDNATATMTQVVDLSNAADFVDGTVCGVDKLVGNFFSYVGLGIDSYQYEAEFEGVYKLGPADWGLYDGINNSLSQYENDFKAVAAVGPDSNNPSFPNTIARYQDRNVGVNQNREMELFFPTQITEAFDMREADFHNSAYLSDYLINREEAIPIRFRVNLNKIAETLTPATAEGYKFPEWRYPIIKELLEQCQLKQVDGTTITDRGGWSGFAKLFAEFFYARDDKNLPLLYHPFQDTGTAISVEQKTTIRAHMTAALNQRFQFAEERMYYIIVQRINERFLSLNLETMPATERDRIAYEQKLSLLKTIVHLVTNIDRTTDFVTDKLENGQFATLITPLRALYENYSEELAQAPAENYYEFSEAERIQDSLYTTAESIKLEPQKRSEQAFTYLSRILALHLYRRVFRGEINRQFELITAAAANENLGTLMVDYESFKTITTENTLTKKKLDGVIGGESRNLRRINIKPKCNDTVSFVFRYIDAFGVAISEDTLEGPDADDIFAVKEKALLSWVVGKQLQRTCQLPTDKKIPVTYNGGPPLFAVDSSNVYSPSVDFINNTYTSAWRTEVAKTNRIFYEKGAAAFFAVNKKLYIPRGTRSIEITAKFFNNSSALGLSPDIGQNKYNSSLLRGEHLNFPPKFFSANNPKTGLAHMKLCLYDNEFKRTVRYPNYYIPRNHVWSELKKLNYVNPNGYFETGRSVDSGGDLVFGYYSYDPPTREDVVVLNASATAVQTGLNVSYQGLPPTPSYPK